MSGKNAINTSTTTTTNVSASALSTSGINRERTSSFLSSSSHGSAENILASGITNTYSNGNEFGKYGFGLAILEND